MLILFSVTRGRKEAFAGVWNEDATLSRPIFKATMSRNVFKDILRFIKTDDHESRQQRRATDKVAGNSRGLGNFYKELPKLFSAGVADVC